MKTIQKTGKFCGLNNQKFYHERFASYKEFYDTVMARQSQAHRKLENVLIDGGRSWVGVSSVEQAQELLLNGWQQNVEKMKVAFSKQLDVIEKDKLCKMVSSIAGYVPIVPNALLGLPNSMIDVRIAHRKTKILNFMISIDRSCGNSVEEIIQKMSKIFAYIAAIERSNLYRCRIEVFFTAFGDYSRNDKTNTSCSVLVKSENQLFDIKRLCFPIIHPAMLRLFMFAWNDSLPIEYSTYHCSGYGASFEHWGDNAKNQFIDIVNENNEKTICLDLKSDIEEVLRKEVK